MEIEITDKKNNPFFKRTEVHFTIKHENQATPNQVIIRNELAESLNVKKDIIVIDRLHSSFGLQQTKGYAKVYLSRKEAESIERKHILNRNKASEGKSKKKGEVAEEKPEAMEEAIEKEKPSDAEGETQETTAPADVAAEGKKEKS